MTEKNKILIFVDWFAPGYKAGGPITSLVNLVQLMREDMDISVVTSDRDLGETTSYTGIRTDIWLQADGYRVYYISNKQPVLKIMKHILRADNYDTIYLNSMWSVHYTWIPLWLLRINHTSKIVLAPRGMLHPSALSISRVKKWLFLHIARQIGLYRQVHFHATTPLEETYIQTVFPNQDVYVVQNVPVIPVYQSSQNKESGILRLLFTGRVHPIKNINFLLKVLAECRDNIELNIVGPIEDADYYRKGIAMCGDLSVSVQVHYLEDKHPIAVQQYVRGCHFLISPTLGENFGHAIFEAFAAGRPVIISDKTPWRGLEAVHAGFDISLDTADVWQEVIYRCAGMNQQEYDQWCTGAYMYAKDFFSKQQFKQEYLQLLS